MLVREKGGFELEEIRGKIRELRIKLAFLRCLGLYVTKEELESIYQKIESLTRIFEEMPLFCVCVSKKEETSRPRPAPKSEITTKRRVQIHPPTPQRTPSFARAVLFARL